MDCGNKQGLHCPWVVKSVAPKAHSPALHDAEWILSYNGLGVYAVLVDHPLSLNSCQTVLLQEQNALSCACAQQSSLAKFRRHTGTARTATLRPALLNALTSASVPAVLYFQSCQLPNLLAVRQRSDSIWAIEDGNDIFTKASHHMLSCLLSHTGDCAACQVRPQGVQAVRLNVQIPERICKAYSTSASLDERRESAELEARAGQCRMHLMD